MELSRIVWTGDSLHLRWESTETDLEPLPYHQCAAVTSRDVRVAAALIKRHAEIRNNRNVVSSGLDGVS